MLLPRIEPLLLLAVSLFTIDFALGHSQHRNPVKQIYRVDSAVIKTPTHRINARSNFELEFSLTPGDKDVKFTLEPNEDILPDGAQIEYIDEFGSITRTEPILRHEYKVYRGTSWLRDRVGWKNAGWARIFVRKDGAEPLFEGAFTLGHDAHHLQLKSSFIKTRHEFDPEVEMDGDDYMLVFKDSDVHQDDRIQKVLGRDGSKDMMCPSDRLDFNIQPGHPVNRMINEMPKGKWGGMGLDNLWGSLTKRQNLDGGSYGGIGNSAGVNLKSSIGNTDGCPIKKQVALIGVATDCTYTADFNTKELARTNVISQINAASNLFEKTFNITLGLSALVISDANCPGAAPATAPWNVPCTSNVTIEDRLNLFSEWRGTRSNDSNALWTLLTTCETGASVGLAWLGQLCQKQAQAQGSQFVSGANVIARTSTEWKVIAHEIGHTMGAVHDCTASTCADSNSVSASMCCPLSSGTCDAAGKFLMNPSTSDQIELFSPCSIGNICSGFKRKSVNTECLTNNKDVTTISQNECGNGIVESGEDCDCGGTEGCSGNKCCNPKTCKFLDTAVCDDANEDCCTNCQFASAGTVCRSSNGVCDPAEKCPGNASTCPKDVVAPDGSDCGNGLKCASGQCTSRDQQCRTVMGQFPNSNETRSCDSFNCQLTCASPEFGKDVCFGMQQNFLDGTPCSGDGRCKNGQCSGASPLGEVKSWIDRHRNIVIGVCAAIGGLILFSFLSCIWGRCRRRRTVKNIPPPNYVQPHDPRWRGPSGGGGGGGGDGGGGDGGGGAGQNVLPMPPPISRSHHAAGYGDAGGGYDQRNAGYPGNQYYQQPQAVRYA